MNTIIVSSPVPACILPVDHPARAIINSIKTDIARTWECHRHPPHDAGDDYDRVQAEDWLSAPGGFK